MLEEADSEPHVAIGAAKELVETARKTILEQLGVPYDAKSGDVTFLMGQAVKAVRLTPRDIPDDAPGAKSIRTLLSHYAQVVQQLAELRNEYGAGHGKPIGHKGLEGRHARLAAGCAAVLVGFLYESHKSDAPPSSSCF